MRITLDFLVRALRLRKQEEELTNQLAKWKVKTRERERAQEI